MKTTRELLEGFLNEGVDTANYGGVAVPAMSGPGSSQPGGRDNPHFGMIAHGGEEFVRLYVGSRLTEIKAFAKKMDLDFSVLEDLCTLAVRKGRVPDLSAAIPDAADRAKVARFISDVMLNLGESRGESFVTRRLTSMACMTGSKISEGIIVHPRPKVVDEAPISLSSSTASKIISQEKLDIGAVVRSHVLDRAQELLQTAHEDRAAFLRGEKREDRYGEAQVLMGAVRHSPQWWAENYDRYLHCVPKALANRLQEATEGLTTKLHATLDWLVGESSKHQDVLGGRKNVRNTGHYVRSPEYAVEKIKGKSFDGVEVTEAKAKLMNGGVIEIDLTVTRSEKNQGLGVAIKEINEAYRNALKVELTKVLGRSYMDKFFTEKRNFVWKTS